MVPPTEPPGWLVDSHIHLDAYGAAELPAALDIARRGLPAGWRYGALIPGVNPTRTRAALARFRGAAHLWHAVGVHPWEPLEPAPASPAAADWLDEIAQLASLPRVVAIGEIGLDALRHRDALEQELAEARFVAQLQLARRLQLPVVLHVVRAHERCLELLRRCGWGAAGGAGGGAGGGSPRGVVHAWGGSLEQAAAYARLGIVVGIGPAVTRERSRRVRRSATELPGDGFLLETDAPYMRAERASGASNTSDTSDAAGGQPADVLEVLRVVARLRGEPEQTVGARSSRLFADVFRVDLVGGASGA